MLEDRLADRGYLDHPAACEVMIVVLEPAEVRIEVQVEATPTDAWLELSTRRRSEWGSFRAMFDRVEGQVGYASVTSGNDIVAIGQAVAVGEWLSIFNMNTATRYRGNGYARAVLETLHTWGLSRGTAHGTLQVTLDNELAQRLYQSGGYRTAYR